MKMNTIDKPSEDVLTTISDLTDNNNHIAAKKEIAMWCIDHSDYFSEKDVWKTFCYFHQYFKELEEYTMRVEHSPFTEIQYIMGMEMDKLISEYFGKDVLAMFDAAR